MFSHEMISESDIKAKDDLKQRRKKQHNFKLSPKIRNVSVLRYAEVNTIFRLNSAIDWTD